MSSTSRRIIPQGMATYSGQEPTVNLTGFGLTAHHQNEDTVAVRLLAHTFGAALRLEDVHALLHSCGIRARYVRPEGYLEITFRPGRRENGTKRP